MMKRVPLFQTVALMCAVCLIDLAIRVTPVAWAIAQSAFDDGIITGSADQKKPAPTDDKKQAVQEKTEPFVSSGSENDILNRLQQRRETLEQREKQLDLRESLLKAADQKVESRIEELKALEARIKQTEAGGSDAQNIKQLATLYEAMKPKDAAKVFERLDMAVLLPVAQTIPPRKLAEIMAQMSPSSAEKLTVELARGSGQAPPRNGPTSAAPLPPGELPSIAPPKAP